MRIPRIHHAGAIASGDVVTLEPQTSRHLLRVLRMTPGAALILFDGRGGEYQARLDHVAGDRAAVIIERFIDSDRESPLSITLGQGIARGERMDYILQKAVELGVTRVVPLFTERCEVRLKGDRLQNRLRHWQALAAGACEQSGRTRLPIIDPPLPLDDWTAAPDKASTQKVIDQARQRSPIECGQVRTSADKCGQVRTSGAGETSPEVTSALKLVLDPAAERSLSELRDSWRGNEILLLSGPEGGLSDGEIARCERAGFTRLRLGARILRAETAPVAVLAILQALWGDLS